MERPFQSYVGDEPYVFVCYSHDDAGMVYAELAWLRDQAVNVWYDEGISAGENWRGSVGDALLGASKVLFYISERSLGSEHCNREINLALDEGKVIIPVYLEEVELTSDLKVGLTRVHALFRASEDYASNLLHALGRSDPSGVPIPRARHGKRKPLYVSLLVAAATIIGWWMIDWDRFATPDRSIVVLPFDSLSDETENDYLAAGLSEELTTALSKLPGLRVVGRTSAAMFNETPRDLTEIREVLGVRYALEGSVRRVDDDLRITARLLDVYDGTELMSIALDEEFQQLLQLPTLIAREITEQLELSLADPDVVAASEVGTGNNAAYALFLKGERLLLGGDSLADYVAAEALYEEAIALDPYFWRAHGQLIFAIVQQAFRSMQLDGLEERLGKLVRRVEALGPQDDRALALARAYLLFLQRDWRTIEHDLAESIMQFPGQTQLLQLYSELLLGNAGLFKAAYDFNDRALLDDPLNPRPVEYAGTMMEGMGQYDQALTHYQRCLDLVPGRAGCLGQTAMTLASLGRLDEALAVETPFDSLSWDCQLRGLAGAVCNPRHESPLASRNGFLAAIAGDFDAAFEWYARAVDLPTGFVNQIRWQFTPPPEFRADPRYAALLERLHLTDAWRTELCHRAQLLTESTRIAVDCSAFAARD